MEKTVCLGFDLAQIPEIKGLHKIWLKINTDISSCFNFCLHTPQTGKPALHTYICSCKTFVCTHLNNFWLRVTNFTLKIGIQQPPTLTLIHVLK